jgi:RHS repeat-associated protein
VISAALGQPMESAAQIITEFPIPTVNANPKGITTGPDGALWFTESLGNKIGRITTAGTVTEFPIPTAGAYPDDITTGPDGALWFTEPGSGKIGRITITGEITEFGPAQFPSTRSTPSGITTGPDGALWFTDSISSVVGRITAAGLITSFAVTGAYGVGGYTGITAGPDGALWFPANDKIFRTTTTGDSTLFFYSPASNPYYITTGPDGALWFTENQGRIGRITTAGTISEFNVPAFRPFGITTGPDGALWFTNLSAPWISRITTTGTYSYFPTPSGAYPWRITAGPDGALWFTEQGPQGSGIGRITSGTPSAKNLGGDCVPCKVKQLLSDIVGVAALSSNLPTFGEGNPVNSGTGNKFQAETDFTADAHTGLSLTRYYNSQDTTSSAFGNAWHSTWHHGMTVSGNSVTVTRADGRRDVFTNNGASIYTADPDVTDRLSPVPPTGTQTGWDLLRADDSIEMYTLSGLLSSITSRAGLVTNLAYDANNRLIRVTGPFGHTLNFVNDSNGRVSQMSVPDGSVYSYAYSSSGNLTAVTYRSGAQRQYLYENTSFPNALTGMIDENGQRFATWTYDAQGRAISSQHAGGAELTTLTYNSDGSSAVTDANGNQHTYTLTTQFGVVKPAGLTGAPVPSVGGKAFSYDANGSIASGTDYDGNVTTYTHDTRGNETSRVMASGTAQARTITTTWDATFNLPTQITDGNRMFSFAYDPNGNLLSRMLSSPGMTSTWGYTYNSAGQVVTAADPAGNVTSYAYDAQGNLVRITNALGQATLLASYDPNGRPLKIQDPNGLVTTLTYNFRGQVTSKTEGQWVTTYSYDAAGQLIRFTRPDGSFLAFTYDPAHRLVGVSDSLGNRIAYALDAASNRIQEQVIAASGTLFRTRSYNYDWVNRVSQAIGALGQTTSYSYDPNGNLTQVSDPLGHTTTGIYDPLNRLTGATDANGGATDFSYDALSRLASVTDPRGLVTSYVYDGLNDVTSLNSPDTGVTAKIYDTAGRAISSTDARGDTTAYAYDALNRLTQAAFADGTATTYHYDQGANGIGRLTAMTDPSGTTAWAYDIHGRVTAKRQTGAGVTLTTGRTYNAVTGQLASIVYPSGSAAVYSYNANGQVSAIGHRRPNGTTTPLLTQIGYQPFGPASSWHTGNGASYSRAFDQDGRIAQLALPAGTTSTLAYDTASRITGIVETGLPAKAFGYDALDRIANYASGATTQTYAYDASGNRTGFTEKQPPFVNATLTYSYDKASNRLLGIGGSWNESFAYDANGNMVSHVSPAAKYSYDYDARNRRTQTFVGAVPTTDLINGLGQRAAQTRRGVTENFVYDEAGHLAGTYNRSAGTAEETVWLGDLPVAVLWAGGEQRYIAPDHLAAPHEITNASGQVVWQWDHDPFGNGQPSGTFTYGLRFPGQFYDQTTRLHYNYFRDYDSRTGRYIESDPIGLGGGINTYGYVDQNPLSYVDPVGEFCLSVFFDSFSQRFVSANDSFSNSMLGRALKLGTGLPLSFVLKKGPAVEAATGYTAPGSVLQWLYYSRNLGLQRALTSFGPDILSATKNVSVGYFVGSLSFNIGLEVGFGLGSLGAALYDASKVGSKSCECQ